MPTAGNWRRPGMRSRRHLACAASANWWDPSCWAGPTPRLAAASAGRPAPQLIVVTKYFPASDVAALWDLGVRDVGENKAQEAEAKAAECACAGLNWHFIGQLQTNKAKSVARYAHAVHSVDRPGLVSALAKAMAGENLRRAEAGGPGRGPLECFVQLDLRSEADAAPGRGGAKPADLLALADALRSSYWCS